MAPPVPLHAAPPSHPPDHTGPDRAPRFDQPRAERAVRELLLAIGEDPCREG